MYLFSDLDRTLIPNGDQPESAEARPLFRKLAASGLIRLAYVSGRDKELVRRAIEDFDLPRPDLVIGDVGTAIYRLNASAWERDRSWDSEISSDWSGHSHGDIVELIAAHDTTPLELQPAPKQGVHKVSYYAEAGVKGRDVTRTVTALLETRNIKASVIWSIDEEADRGLLDILPAGASKISAIRFLMNAEGIDEQHLVFAGDSGNDLDGLTSCLPAILVANARRDVRFEAVEAVREKGCETQLYLAGGGPYGLNGNYSAGVLEGLGYFFPEIDRWLRRKTAPSA